ncbi:MAG: terpene utilization protein AtuA, partial [Pseudomonadota bacterium]
AARKARSFATATLNRARRKLTALGAADYTEVSVEVMGDESHYGAFASGRDSREVVLKIAAKHTNPQALSLLLKEGSGLALSAPPGLTLHVAGRPRPAPVVRLFSLLVPKTAVAIAVHCQGESLDYVEPTNGDVNPVTPTVTPPPAPSEAGPMTTVLLRDIAWGRSGDKGDNANIGIIPRHRMLAPWLWQQLTIATVRERFDHFVEGDIERFYLPGLGAINLLLHQALGGGGIASLRNDPQGKSYAQILLDCPITVPAHLLEELEHGSL